MCRYKRYLSDVNCPDSAQSTIHDSFSRVSDHYLPSHPKQTAITDTIIDDLIVGCALPLSIVENSHFRHFLSVVDKKYAPTCRSSVKKALDNRVLKKEEALKSQLSQALSVNLTVDIWSDRLMRGFLGITAHYILNNTSHPPLLQSALLSMSRFKGSHTGDNIALAFEGILDHFDIRGKVDHVITDNAANMRKAFQIVFPLVDDDESESVPNSSVVAGSDLNSSADLNLDDPETWLDLSPSESQPVNESLQNSSRGERLSCFNHSLHLVVGDGLKETRCMSTVLSKCCKLSSLLHHSSLFKDAFEEKILESNKYGKGIPTAVATRWNSTLRQLQAVLSFKQEQLASLLESTDNKNLLLTTREWAQLSEVCEILDPFAEATDSTEGEKCATISKVLPAVLKLHRHLLSMKQKTKFCLPLVKSLLISVETRFSGLLSLTVPNENYIHDPESNGGAFGSEVYVVATFFDPLFRLKWIDKDIRLATQSADRKDLLRRQVLGKST